MFESEPFGQRAVRLGLVTSQQVREALETQQLLSEKSGLLGEILVEMGWMDPQHYIEIVQELMEEDADAERERIQERFVARATEKHYVNPDQVDQARKIQSGWSRKNKLIGQVMVEMGFIRPEQLQNVLTTYKRNVE